MKLGLGYERKAKLEGVEVLKFEERIFNSQLAKMDKNIVALCFTKIWLQHVRILKCRCKESSLVKDGMGKVINIGSKNYMS